MSEPRERAINIPWSVQALIVILIGIFGIGALLGVDPNATPWGVSPQDLADGRFVNLLTAMFVHGSWMHVLGNCVFAAAFATPVARRFGEDGRGAGAFIVFYLLCGVIGNLGYAALNIGSPNPVLGASGAIAGMMGAASRMIGRPDGDLAPFRSQYVIGMAVSWLVINVLFGAVFVGMMPGAGGALIAWQVHLVGYAAGLLLFAPALSVIGRRQAAVQPDHGIEN